MGGCVNRGVHAVHGRGELDRRRLDRGTNINVSCVSGLRAGNSGVGVSALRGVVATLGVAPSRLFRDHVSPGGPRLRLLTSRLTRLPREDRRRLLRTFRLLVGAIGRGPGHWSARVLTIVFCSGCPSSTFGLSSTSAVSDNLKVPWPPATQLCFSAFTASSLGGSVSGLLPVTRGEFFGVAVAESFSVHLFVGGRSTASADSSSWFSGRVFSYGTLSFSDFVFLFSVLFVFSSSLW